MRNYLLYACLSIAVGTTACSKTENPAAESAGQGMRFEASVADKESVWSAQTRGAAIDGTNISEFSTSCFNTGRGLWADVAATSLPNKMHNLLVTRKDGEWSYGPSIKWEAGDGAYFTFFGYSPFAKGIYKEPENGQGNNLEVLSKATDAGVPRVSYSTLDYVPTQVDLLFAKPIYNTRPVAKVRMQFVHALSQIRFKAWSERVSVFVTAITISDVQHAGEFGMDGSLIPSAEVKTFALTELRKGLSTDKEKMTDLTDGGNSFMLLPQDLTGNLTATIVLTYIEDGVEKKSTPYLIKNNWEGAHSYTYTAKLGQNATGEIGITGVTVADWVVDSSEDLKTEDGTSETI